jgi:hypothetical protein
LFVKKNMITQILLSRLEKAGDGEGEAGRPAMIKPGAALAEVDREAVSYTHLTLPTTPYV